MKKLLITKEQFIEIMNNIKLQKEKNEKFNVAIEEMCDGFIMFNPDDKYLESLLFLLSTVFYQTPNAMENTIEWYLYEELGEDNAHPMYMDGYSANINNEEILWELLCAEFEVKANKNEDAITKFFHTFGTPCTEKEFNKKNNITVTTMMYAEEFVDTMKRKVKEKMESDNI